MCSPTGSTWRMVKPECEGREAGPRGPGGPAYSSCPGWPCPRERPRGESRNFHLFLLVVERKVTILFDAGVLEVGLPRTESRSEWRGQLCFWMGVVSPLST